MSQDAELIADGGASAASDDFFRSAEFLAAEPATHTIAIDGEGTSLRLPVIVRGVPGTDRCDAVSPYGYPGGALNGSAPNPNRIDWSPTGLVSLFIRDRVGEPVLSGGRERSGLLLHDPAEPRKLRDTFAWEARRNERNGWSCELIAGPKVGARTLTSFNDAYEQTMDRAEAAKRYYFGTDYLRACLDSPSSWLAVARNRSGELGAAAIAGLSDGVLHYFLAGTADAHRAPSPGKNVLIALIDHADALATPLNLGGGIKPGDGLEAFKRGFANAKAAFVTHEIVCDQQAYATLGAPAGAEPSFFPAYRAPAT